MNRLVATPLALLACLLLLSDCRKSTELRDGGVVQRKGLFGPVLVVQDDGVRYLRFGSVEDYNQSAYNLRDPNELIFAVFRGALEATRLEPPPSRALVMGAGGGNYLRALRHHYPSCAVDGVDIDPVVVQLARDYFDLGDEEDDQLTIHVEDAAQFIRGKTALWDHILLDTYDSETIPMHLRTVEYFTEIRRGLRPGGNVLLNLSMSPEVERPILENFTRAFPRCLFARISGSGNSLAAGFVEAEHPLEAWHQLGYQTCESLLREQLGTEDAAGPATPPG